MEEVNNFHYGEAPAPRKGNKKGLSSAPHTQHYPVAIDKKTKQKYRKELKIDKAALKRLRKKSKKKIDKTEGYTVYKTNFYARISNFFFEKKSRHISHKHVKFYKNLYNKVSASGMQILARTYLSVMLFSSFLIFVLSLLTFGVLFFLEILPVATAAIVGGLGSILLGVLMFALLYGYPSSKVNSRTRKMKNDLPFVVMHMAAIAGSGAKPIAVFNTLLNTGEYPGLGSEIKKIVNYANLFGYDLSTALKTVAKTTPSDDFKEVLNGIVATIETGGDLSKYLKAKGEDALNKYRLEREKYVKTLTTYSDIYIGILIAAPLLFLVILAIIDVLGGSIGGFSVNSLAVIGTYGVLPLLNIIFIIFINLIQPEA